MSITVENNLFIFNVVALKLWVMTSTKVMNTLQGVMKGPVVWKVQRTFNFLRQL